MQNLAKNDRVTLGTCTRVIFKIVLTPVLMIMHDLQPQGAKMPRTKAADDFVSPPV
jgi:hypothetical protein